MATLIGCLLAAVGSVVVLEVWRWALEDERRAEPIRIEAFRVRRGR